MHESEILAQQSRCASQGQQRGFYAQRAATAHGVHEMHAGSETSSQNYSGGKGFLHRRLMGHFTVASPTQRLSGCIQPNLAGIAGPMQKDHRLALVRAGIRPASGFFAAYGPQWRLSAAVRQNARHSLRSFANAHAPLRTHRQKATCSQPMATAFLYKSSVAAA